MRCPVSHAMLRSSFRPFFATAALLVLFLASSQAAMGQDDDEGVESPWLPGLVANYTSQGKSVTSIASILSLTWPDQRPDARLASGDFTATFQGSLLAQGSGEYQLEAFAVGDVKVTLGGEAVLEGSCEEAGWIVGKPVKLSFDHHPLEITYRSKTKQPLLKLFWRGPQFVLEPIPARYLMHDRSIDPGEKIRRGQSLALALRCDACHQDDAAMPKSYLAAPSLAQQQPWLQSDWVVKHLSGVQDSERTPRRMPHFAISRDEAKSLAAWLTKHDAKIDDKGKATESRKKPAGKKAEAPAKIETATKEQGELLVASLGCMACHQRGELGQAGHWGGTSLDEVASKRTTGFIAAWLSDPAKINRHHRMPVFDLEPIEINSIALALAGEPLAQPQDNVSADAGGNPVEIAAKFHCAKCHELPQADAKTMSRMAAPLNQASKWEASCASLAEPRADQPAYGLDASDAAALKSWYASRAASSLDVSMDRGELLLQRQNCLACHDREGIDRDAWLLAPLLTEKLPEITRKIDGLPAIPVLTPPTLHSVGDKFHDAALVGVMSRKQQPHRSYLAVRMPRFSLTDAQLTELASYFITSDRIPPRAAEVSPVIASEASLQTGGSRLVTTDGFGCTSCHQVGSVMPVNAPANARGPSLSMMDQRIRREWFDRWVRSPQRIVPRMEMPSIQLAVKGVLHDHLPTQLDAVWKVLNQEGFEPPLPNPVRVMRQSGAEEKAPLVLTDVIELDKSFGREKPLVRSFAIGLSNRHNLIFDLESGSLLDWRGGDLARQRTRGKTWYWELAGFSLLKPELKRSEIGLLIDGKYLAPVAMPDGVFRLEGWSATEEKGRMDLRGSLLFEPTPKEGSPKDLRNFVAVKQSFVPIVKGNSHSGFTRWIDFEGVPEGSSVVLQLVDPQLAKQAKLNAGQQRIELADRGCYWQLNVDEFSDFQVTYRDDGSLVVASRLGKAKLRIDYITSRAIDLFPNIVDLNFPQEIAEVDVAAGLQATRLPLRGDIMPTAIAFAPDGTMHFASLKGQVYAARDTDSDGLEDELTLLADGLPAPYGIAVEEKGVLVLSKFALLELQQWPSAVKVAASGWGYTADYHDWAVGLPSNGRGGYLVAIPCQQDKRTADEARLRGKFIELLPRESTDDDPRSFAVRMMSAGHRFPMGLARSSRGDIFVTDNQGHYNPFNELNHVEQGSHFGFINALEKEAKTPVPPLKAPAIDIPHPWTRSVNGIMFLDTPAKLAAKQGSVFGAWEGHLVGCEYDTRRLIRMSLEKIDGMFQGAAYPLSRTAGENSLLGPVVAAVSPTGELMIGNLRDSGWGAGNNIGDITKIKVEPAKFAAGIAEVKVQPDGFRVVFTRPVDREKAADVKSYSIRRYTRESTPAYGGADVDSRDVQPVALRVQEDGRAVDITLGKLAVGYVYELQLKNLNTDGETEFFPAEAHYTLRKVPAK